MTSAERLLLLVSIAVPGCADDAVQSAPEVPVLGFCDGGAPSATATALLARAPGSFRPTCLGGVYENTGLVSGGDFYTNSFVSRMELRATSALAAIRCTFEGPLSNPPAEREPRDVIATVNVSLAVADWGIEFLQSATDTKQDPNYISSCATELLAARWPFCVASPDTPDLIDVPEGETFCVYVEADGTLQSIRREATTAYKEIATKIAD